VVDEMDEKGFSRIPKIRFSDWLQPNLRSSDKEKFKFTIWLKPLAFIKLFH